MGDLFSFILSPHGAALFVLFWIIKALAGFWLASRAIHLLPARMQARPQRWLDALTPKMTRRGTSERHDT